MVPEKRILGGKKSDSLDLAGRKAVRKRKALEGRRALRKQEPKRREGSKKEG